MPHLKWSSSVEFTVIPQFHTKLFIVQNLPQPKVIVTLAVLQYGYILLLMVPICSHNRRLIEILFHIDTSRTKVEMELNVFFQAQQSHVME